MFLTSPRLRTQPILLACALLVAAVQSGAAASRTSSIEALAASAPTVRLSMASRWQPTLETWKPADARGCSTEFQAYRCFESSPTGLALNVGSFFDRNRTPTGRLPQVPRSSSAHYFIKYFDPASNDTLQIHGIQFRGSVSRGSIDFPLAGIVITDATTPRFPTALELVDLQRRNIEVRRASNAQTCVDLTSDRVLLTPGKAAWAVLNFPDAPDSVFVGVQVDTLPPDHVCDFLSPNTGTVWYRPDPAQRPVLDWAMTVFAAPKRRSPGKVEEPWSQVKRLYR